MRAASGRSFYFGGPRGRIRVVHCTLTARRRCGSVDARQWIGTAGLAARIRIQRRAAYRGGPSPHSHTEEILIMFTGIIVATGLVSSLAEKGGDLELGIDAAALDLDRIAIGDSVSGQGACLPVTRREGTRFYAGV